MTTLEAVTIDRILAGEVVSGTQVEELGPREIARVMVAIQRMRRDKIEEIRQLATEVADASKIATIIRAQTFLSAEGPQQQRDQESRLAAAPSVFTVEAMKAELEAAREALKLLKDDWDTCRSINSNVRAERSAIEGYGSLCAAPRWSGAPPRCRGRRTRRGRSAVLPPANSPGRRRPNSRRG